MGSDMATMTADAVTAAVSMFNEMGQFINLLLAVGIAVSVMLMVLMFIYLWGYTYSWRFEPDGGWDFGDGQADAPVPPRGGIEKPAPRNRTWAGVDYGDGGIVYYAEARLEDAMVDSVSPVTGSLSEAVEYAQVEWYNDPTFKMRPAPSKARDGRSAAEYLLGEQSKN